jgi:DNA-binding MarR family transcriptional regulator
MDQDQDARRLLDRIGLLRHPSDLDLLIFFARHPRSVLTSEQLAAFLGYGVKDVVASLDLLLGAALITRTPNPSHAARMHVFSVDGPGGEWLPELLKLASTREGRLAIIWELRRRASGAIRDSQGRVPPDAAERGERPFLVRKPAGDHGER